MQILHTGMLKVGCPGKIINLHDSIDHQKSNSCTHVQFYSLPGYKLYYPNDKCQIESSQGSTIEVVLQLQQLQHIAAFNYSHRGKMQMINSFRV